VEDFEPQPNGPQSKVVDENVLGLLFTILGNLIFGASVLGFAAVREVGALSTIAGIALSFVDSVSSDATEDGNTFDNFTNISSPVSVASANILSSLKGFIDNALNTPPQGDGAYHTKSTISITKTDDIVCC
jgi:hypothetical protein